MIIVCTEKLELFLLTIYFTYLLSQMQAKMLHEEGKAWYKADKLKEAMKKYGEALTVCGTYRLMQEGSEIYYSCAVLHMALAEFQTAFEECTLSLRIYPTPKVG